MQEMDNDERSVRMRVAEIYADSRSTSQSEKDTGESWPTVFASMLALAFGPAAVLIMCFGTFLPALHADMGWPVANIAIGASLISISIMVLSPVQGWLVDRWGGRAVVLTFLPIWTGALAFVSFVPRQIGFFYAGCVLLPFAGLGVWPLSYMQVVSTSFDKRLGIALGLTTVGLGIGASALPPVIAMLFSHVGWRGAYRVLAAIVGLVVWPVAARWLRSGRTVADDRAAPEASGLRVSEALRTRAYWITMATFLVAGANSTGLLANQSAILIAAGARPEAAVALPVATGLTTIAARVTVGWLLDRIPANAVGLAMLLLAALACELLAGPAVRSSAMLAAVLLGMLVGAEIDLLSIIIRRYQGIRAFGRLFGVAFSAFQLGGALGAGVLAASLAKTASYSIGLHLLATAGVVGALLFLGLGPYRYGPATRARPSELGRA